MTLGKSLLKIWLLRPSTTLSIIRARHDAVECFCLPENVVTTNAMHNHLKGFKHIRRIMGEMRSGKAKLGDWKNLVKVSSSVLDGLTERPTFSSLLSMRPCFEILYQSYIKRAKSKL